MLIILRAKGKGSAMPGLAGRGRSGARQAMPAPLPPGHILFLLKATLRVPALLSSRTDRTNWRLSVMAEAPAAQAKFAAMVGRPNFAASRTQPLLPVCETFQAKLAAMEGRPSFTCRRLILPAGYFGITPSMGESRRYP